MELYGATWNYMVQQVPVWALTGALWCCVELYSGIYGNIFSSNIMELFFGALYKDMLYDTRLV
jgi:hypothetical protein